MILIDTNVWSIAFRRMPDHRSAAESMLYRRIRELMISGDAALTGLIRQELLSGVKVASQFEYLQKVMTPFRLFDLHVSTFDLAADCFNRCRLKGIAADAVDMVTCAASIQNGAAILTVDEDFRRYATSVPIRLA